MVLLRAIAPIILFFWLPSIQFHPSLNDGQCEQQIDAQKTYLFLARLNTGLSLRFDASSVNERTEWSKL